MVGPLVHTSCTRNVSASGLSESTPAPTRGDTSGDALLGSYHATVGASLAAGASSHVRGESPAEPPLRSSARRMRSVEYGVPRRLAMARDFACERKSTQPADQSVLGAFHHSTDGHPAPRYRVFPRTSAMARLRRSIAVSAAH